MQDVGRFRIFGTPMKLMPGWCSDLKYAAALASSVWHLWKPSPAAAQQLRRSESVLIDSPWMAYEKRIASCHLTIIVYCGQASAWHCALWSNSLNPAKHTSALCCSYLHCTAHVCSLLSPFSQSWLGVSPGLLPTHSLGRRQWWPACMQLVGDGLVMSRNRVGNHM
jgi:hypothetical protein